jgi:parallel beta-helix repeat protein
LVGAAALGAFLTAMAVDAPANAATTYVVNGASSACSDTGSGTPTQPFCTIAAAAKVAHAGDTVQIFPGTYAGTAVNPANSGSAGSPITFAAQPGVTISGGTSAFVLSSRNYIDVSGFSISATSSVGISVSNGTNDIISNNVVTGTGSYGISISGGSNDTVSGNTESFAGTPQVSPAAGIYLHNLSGGLVQGNVTHDNSAHGIYLTGTTTGVLVAGNTSYHNAYQYQRNANGIDDIAPANSLVGNITYANEDTGINIYPGGDNALIADNVTYGNGDHGIDDYNVTGGRIINNTVYGNCTDGINVEGTSGGYTIEDNVSMNNATGAVINPTPILQTNGKPDYTNLCNRRVGNIGVYDSAPATSTADYNLVWQSGPGAEYSWAGTTYSTQAALYAATGQEQHGSFANPGFVNAAAASFQLTSGSPAIDAANTSVTGHQPTDILGVSPYDDMGAYEYVSAGGQVGPAAALTVTPASGTAPLSVTADASGSTAGSSPISTYTFNFGDGTTTGPQAAATAGHTYQAAGTYTVTVTVTDTSNLTAQATQTVTASPAATSPAAALTVTPATGTAPLSVTADASGSTAGSSPISTYTFNFGDGTTTGPQAAATAGHTYQAAGTYTVTVTVTDTSNLTAQATQTVTANAAVTTTAKYVNQIATNYSTSSHTSGYVVVWRTGGVAAGDLIIVTIQLTGTTAGTVTGTDTLGDTLSVVSDISDGNGDRLVTVAGIAHAGLPVNDQVIINFPQAATYRMTADEVSGVTTADQEAAAGGTAGAFSSGTTAPTARGGEFVYAVVATFGGTSITWPAGWSAETSYTVGSNALGRAYQIPAAIGTFAATGTVTGSWLAEVVTFK